jgi:hypothetical protein
VAIGKRGAVGYMRGRGSEATRTPKEAETEWLAVVDGLRARLDDIEADGLALLKATEAVGEALDKSQPPMFRRMVVRWWRLSGGGRRRPVLARVEAGAKQHIKLTVAHPNHQLRTDRGFGLCADLARRGVTAFWALHAERRALDSLVVALGRTLNRGRAQRREIVRCVTDEAQRLTVEAKERLVSVGYDVAADDVIPEDAY